MEQQCDKIKVHGTGCKRKKHQKKPLEFHSCFFQCLLKQLQEYTFYLFSPYIVGNNPADLILVKHVAFYALSAFCGKRVLVTPSYCKLRGVNMAEN